MKKNMILALMIGAVTASAATALAADKEPMLISPAADDIIVGTPQITVNGDAIDLSNSGLSQYIFEENGNVMVPLRAVAEKMGYTVGWDGEKRLFTAEDSEWSVRAYIDEDLYYGVTKIEGAVGMTAPQSYGVVSRIIDNSTFVPAKMFELMGYDYSTIGQYVNFTKAGILVDENGQEYSNDTLIISVAADADEAALMKLFESKNLQVINKMDNFKMYTVRLEKPMNADELEAYIADLEKNGNILAVNKDYIMQLDTPAQIANPFVPYESIAAAEKALSFKPSVPSYVPAGYAIDEITAIEDNFLQIIYKNDSDETICYRTAVGSDDISGDYNVYASTKTIKVGAAEVTARGNEKVAVAVWSADNLTYSIQSDKELSEKEITDIIQSL